MMKNLCMRGKKAMVSIGKATLLAAVFQLPTTVQAQIAGDCPGGFRYPVVVLSEGLEIIGQQRSFGRTEFLQIFDAVDPSNVKSSLDIIMENGEQATIPRNQVAIYSPRGGGQCTLEITTMDDVAATSLDIGSPLRAKAIASVTRDSILLDQENASEGGEEITAIKMRMAPNDSAPVNSEVNLFSIVYVNAIYRDPITQNFWYFVGTSSNGNFDLDENDALTRNMRAGFGGWVRSEDLIFWAQREAIYPTSAQAANLMVYMDPARQDEMVRLNYVDDGAPDRNNAMGKIPLLSTENGMHEVVVPINRLANGETVVASGGGGGTAPNDETSNDMRYWIGRILAGAGKLDVLFVMDNTESMEVYRRSVLEGISDAAQRSTFGNKLNLAFAMFGDSFTSPVEARRWGRSGPRQGYDASWSRTMPANGRFQFALMDFGWRGEIPSMQDLDTYFGGTYSDPRRDKPEIGIGALRTAIDAASWDTDPDTIRFVFYIGDDFSRLPPSETLAAEIKAKNVNIIPINVAGSAVDRFNESWISQMNLLTLLTNQHSGLGGVYDPQIAYAAGGANSANLTRTRVRDIVGAVFGFIEGFQSSTGLISDAVLQVQNDLTSRNIPGGTFTEQTFRNLLGGTAEELVNLFGSTEIVHVGYYPEANAQTYVALTRLEHSALSGAINQACIAMGDSENIRTSLDRMAETLAESFLGEKRAAYAAGEGETIPEFFNRLTHLPVEYFSIFGNRTTSEFYSWTQRASRDELLDVQKELCLSDRLLRDVSDSVYVERGDYRFVEYNERLAAPVFRAQRQLKGGFDWLWGNETAIRFYFIPKAFFPSGNHER